MMHKQGIHIVAVTGSVRPGNFTSKALALVVDEIKQQPDARVKRIDPATTDLPLPGKGQSEDAKQIQKLISEASGVVLATPEYHGSYSSVIKLFIENMGFPSVLAGKPVALLGVAAGQIGAIKALEHLRSVCSHIGAIVLPGPVSVAGVQRLFDEQGRCLDEPTEKRIRGVATTLLDYIRRTVCPRVALEEMARRGETKWMQVVSARS
ncbi:NAD(P)H-dependent oxidoreductase [Acidobacteriia bacterium AH_259_A11_L15]|nr:NAD(P)H-dependent oxidoreductase [Acidobacteriia bacterium AH_259_A11_L15]